MNSRCSAVLLLALLTACGRRQHQGPPVEAAIARPVTVDVPAAVDVPAPPAVDMPAAVDVPSAVDVPAPPSPDAELVRGLASGGVELSAHIDPAHGVVLVTYLEPSPSGRSGERRSTRRLCGAAAARDAALRARLRDAVRQASDNGSMECRGDECVVPGMEYQPAYRLRLGRAPDGTRVLLGAMQLSEATLSEEWMERVRAYVDQSLASARSRPCPR